MKNKTVDYVLETSYTIINMEEYINSYFDMKKFHELCSKCDKYGTLWSCPPYNFNVGDYINKYKYAYIICTKILLDDSLIRETKKDEVINCTYKIINDVRKKLDKKLLKLEKRYPDSISLFAGSCISCNTCTRLNSSLCIKPDLMRYSLESLGFDVAKTVSELLKTEIKWAKDSLPEYFTLVSAFFTNKKDGCIQCVKKI